MYRFLEFSLCLSRACLGKMRHFIYKWRKKTAFVLTNVLLAQPMMHAAVCPTKTTNDALETYSLASSSRVVLSTAAATLALLLGSRRRRQILRAVTRALLSVSPRDYTHNRAVPIAIIAIRSCRRRPTTLIHTVVR